MASTAYVLCHTLSGGHSDTVNALVFSPDGKSLASGGDDGFIIIWDVQTGKVAYRLGAEDKVDSLVWHPLQPETVIVGCAGGSVQQIHHFSPLTSKTYAVPLGGKSFVSSMDFNPTTACLAASIGPDILIAKESEPNNYSVVMPLPHPPDEDEVDCSACFAATIKFDPPGKRLVATYPSHGIICWDIETRESLWRIHPSEDYPSMGHSTVTRNFRFIAVHNFRDGLNLYPMKAGGGRSRKSYWLGYSAATDRAIALQVSFIHNDRALVCGSSTGSVSIWQVSTGEQFQSLPHEGHVMMAVASCQQDDISYLATGSASLGSRTYINIWRARIAGISAEKTRSLSWWNRSQQPFLNWFVSEEDKVQTTCRVIGIAVIALAISWGTFEGFMVVPWGQLLHVLVNATTRVWVALREFWFQSARTAVNLYLFVNFTTRWAITFATRWARAQALQALGLPPDIMERLPPS